MLHKDNCKTRHETFKFWDFVRLILEIWQYLILMDELCGVCGEFCGEIDSATEDSTAVLPVWLPWELSVYHCRLSAILPAVMVPSYSSGDTAELLP